VLDAGFSKFLFGKEREKRKHEDDEMFEVRVGATDPNARAHQFAGSKRVTATPSVHTYLTLTLLDPYAYGISEKRAVLMFIVSVIQRAIARNTRPEDFEDREKKDEIDAEIDERPDLALLTQDTLVDGDEEEAARIRKAILSMPTFKKFTQCLRDHGSDVAHTANPAFHAQYTLLKATYLVHFASYYLAMAVNSVLRDEMNIEKPGDTSKDDRKCTLSRSVVSAMEGVARSLASAVDKLNEPGVTEWDKTDLVRQIVRANRLACRIQDRCGYSHKGTEVARLDRLIKGGKIVDVTGFGAPGAPGGKPDNATDLVAMGHTDLGDLLAKEPDHETDFPLYTRSSEMFDRETADATRDLVSQYDDDDLKKIGAFHVAYMMYLVLRSTEDFESGPGYDHPEEKLRRTRFFRFRPLVLFLSRLYSYVYEVYTSLVQPEKKQPVIVTMLVGAGWKRSAQRENEAERLQKMFSALTRVMSNMLMFCHHVKGDLYRGPILMKQLRKLYFSNLALMAVTQQKLLRTVPSCHPFYRGAETQLTLPTAVAVKMIPTDSVLPPNYSLASVAGTTYDEADYEGARKGAVNIAQILTGQRASSEIFATSAGAFNVAQYIDATGAMDKIAAKSAAVAGAGKGKIDVAAHMRALMHANAFGR
jgi:hypothetical protein